MKIVYVTKITREGDWHFFDLEGDVYAVDKPEEFDCSVCAIGSKQPVEKIRLVIPFKQLKEIASQLRL